MGFRAKGEGNSWVLRATAGGPPNTSVHLTPTVKAKVEGKKCLCRKGFYHLPLPQPPFLGRVARQNENGAEDRRQILFLLLNLKKVGGGRGRCLQPLNRKDFFTSTFVVRPRQGRERQAEGRSLALDGGLVARRPRARANRTLSARRRSAGRKPRSKIKAVGFANRRSIVKKTRAFPFKIRHNFAVADFSSRRSTAFVQRRFNGSPRWRVEF
jgi:hypothetical protein